VRPGFKFLAFFAALVFFTAALPVSGQEDPMPDEPFYLLPQTVYVGDTARLVLPLGTTFSGVQSIVLDRPEQLPGGRDGNRDLVISRVEIENRGGRSRLLVDFTAYAPGLIEFPPIEVAPFVFPGLEVNIASILDTDLPANSRVLSPYAPPVPVPGTMGIIYASALGIFVLILGSAAMGIWGFPWFHRYRKRLLKRRMIRGLSRAVKQFRVLLARDNEAGGMVLDRLNGELRRFLEFFTGRSCAGMVPWEFLAFTGPGQDGQYGGSFLSGLFSRCDRLRFGGGRIDSAGVLVILDEVQGFAEACDREEGTELFGIVETAVPGTEPVEPWRREPVWGGAK
jgi:hypothetical protein